MNFSSSNSGGRGGGEKSKLIEDFFLSFFIHLFFFDEKEGFKLVSKEGFLNEPFYPSRKKKSKKNPVIAQT